MKGAESAGLKGLGRPQPMLRWYVVHTHPRAEAKALAQLRRQGFEAYLPRMTRRRPPAAQGPSVSAPPPAAAATPLFPRYLFVALDLEAQRWRAVHSTIGVHQLITQGGTPASEPLAVPDDVVTALRAQENAGGLIDFKGELQPGDKVVITDGPFAEFAGHLEHMPGGDRVMVLLNILGRETRACVPRAHVEPASMTAAA